MSCYSCGGNPNTFCKECLNSKDTWIAPVDKLPDTFMGDFDHLFRTPDGNLYALAPERDRWIRVNGEAGNSVSYNDTELKKRITALEGRTDNFVSGIGVSREGGKVKLKYTFIDGTSKEVEFEDKDTKSIAYDDTALKARVKALEDKPAPTIPKEPVHRFYNGDIPGAGNPADIKTVRKNNFRNPDGIKSGDTLEDFATDSNSVSRGIWKVLEVDGDNVKVQGIGNYFTNLRKNLNYNPDTKQLSIDGGNTITLPSEKQTISKQGNKLVLSNGGGEVDLPTPNNATAYDDSFLRDKVTALENKVDGGDNLICNSAFPKSKNGWGYWLANQDNSNLSLRTHPFYYNNTENMFVLSNNTQNGVPMALTRFKVKRNTNYSLNFVGFSTDNLRGINLYFLGREKGNSSDFTNVVNVSEVNTPLSPTGLKQFHFTFNTGNSDEGYLRIDNKGTNNSNESLLYISEFDLYEGTSNRSYQPSVKCVLDSLGNREDNDRQTLTLNGNTLSISNGNSVTLPSNNQPVHRFYNGDISGIAETNTVKTVPKSGFRNPDGIKVGDTVEDYWANNNSVNRGIWKVIEVNGDNVKVQGIGNYDIRLPNPDLSQYVPTTEYNKLKGALTNLLQNLKDSGAWNQTGATIFEGSLKSGRNIATGNINIFGGTTDGNSFIRTNNGSTENDLAGGVS